MNIVESQGTLNLSGELTIGLQGEIPPILLLAGPGNPAFLNIENKQIYAKVFFPKNYTDKRIDNILEEGNYDSQEDYYLVTVKLESNRLLDILTDLESVPTLILSWPYINSTDLVLRFQLNKNFSTEFSSVISKYILMNHYIKDFNLEHSDGAVYSQIELLDVLPVSIVQYSIPVNRLDSNTLLESMESQHAVARLYSNYSMTECKLLIVSHENIANTKKIGKLDYVYQTSLNVNLLQNIRTKAAKRGIFIDVAYMQVKGDKIIFTEFLPSIFMNQYLSVLFSSFQDNSGESIISLLLARKLDRDIFKQIG